jgi:hypothetical protein
MTLLNPIWLWGLGGLVIPVMIHLLSRKEGKTIRIGSIRFLAETATSKFSSVRLNEVALLALRSLLVLLMVLFLAGLLFPSARGNTSQKWVVVEKGLENNEHIKNLLDSLQKDGYETRRLSTSFPGFEDDSVTQPPDYYKLSEDLSQQDNVQAIVIAVNSLSGFKGKRISLPENITWLSYPVSSAGDLPTGSLPDSDTVRITLAYDKEFQYEKKIIRAALHALQTEAPAKIVVEETDIHTVKPSHPHWLIWLSNDIPAYEGRLLRFSEDAISDLIVRENTSQWILTKRLHEENAVEQHLAVQLMSMLFNEQLKQEISKHDKRTLPDALAWSNNNKVQSAGTLEAGQPADKILILLITLAFIAERVLAYYRKQ